MIPNLNPKTQMIHIAASPLLLPNHNYLANE